MWHLILTQGIAFGAGMGFLFVSSVGIPSQWFTKRRSLANGMAAAGSGIGGLVYSIGTNAMIKNLGLPWTFRILAALTFVVAGISTLLIRDRNANVGAVHIALHWELFKRPEYCLLLSWACFSSFGYVVLIFSLADYCQTVGFTATQGAIVSAMFSRECPSGQRESMPPADTKRRPTNRARNIRPQCPKVSAALSWAWLRTTTVG